jgi:hypothetical protein
LPGFSRKVGEFEMLQNGKKNLKSGSQTKNFFITENLFSEIREIEPKTKSQGKSENWTIAF